MPAGLIHDREHTLECGTYDVAVTFRLPFLARDRYYIDLIIADTNKSYIHYLESAVYFDLESKIFDGSNFRYEANQKMGKVLLTEAVTIDIK